MTFDQSNTGQNWSNGTDAAVQDDVKHSAVGYKPSSTKIEQESQMQTQGNLQRKISKSSTGPSNTGQILVKNWSNATDEVDAAVPDAVVGDAVIRCKSGVNQV